MNDKGCVHGGCQVPHAALQAAYVRIPCGWLPPVLRLPRVVSIISRITSSRHSAVDVFRPVRCFRRFKVGITQRKSSDQKSSQVYIKLKESSEGNQVNMEIVSALACACASWTTLSGLGNNVIQQANRIQAFLAQELHLAPLTESQIKTRLLTGRILLVRDYI